MKHARKTEISEIESTRGKREQSVEKGKNWPPAYAKLIHILERERVNRDSTHTHAEKQTWVRSNEKRFS